MQNSINGLGNVQPVVLVSYDSNGNVTAVNPDGSGAAPSPTNQTTATYYYKAITDFAGATVGDTLTNSITTRSDTNPPTVISNNWFNTRTGLYLTTPPSSEDVTLESSSALTNTQLRSSPVAVEDANSASKLDAIKQAIEASIQVSGSIWIDATQNPPVSYIRREVTNESTLDITIAWYYPDGSLATPDVASLSPVNSYSSILTSSLVFYASVDGTDYLTGDLLIHAYGINTATSTPQLAYSFWINANTNLILSVPPTAGTYAVAAQPSTQEGVWTTDRSWVLKDSTDSITAYLSVSDAENLASVSAQTLASSESLGAASDPSYNGDGDSTIISALKGIWNKVGSRNWSLSHDNDSIVANLGTLNGAALDASLTATQSTPGTAALNAVTIQGNVDSTPVKVTLSEGEASDLSTVANAQGTSATDVAQLPGGAGVLGWLSAIYAKVSGILKVEVAALPLPEGAATSALQDTNNSIADSIASNTANIPAKGAAATDASLPVNIATDQVVPISADTLPLPEGGSGRRHRRYRCCSTNWRRWNPWLAIWYILKITYIRRTFYRKQHAGLCC